jgi:hypothetical protein
MGLLLYETIFNLWFFWGNGDKFAFDLLYMFGLCIFESKLINFFGLYKFRYFLLIMINL